MLVVRATPYTPLCSPSFEMVFFPLRASASTEVRMRVRVPIRQSRQVLDTTPIICYARYRAERYRNIWGYGIVPPSKRSELRALLDALPFREQLNVLLKAGIPAQDMLSMHHCRQHAHMKLLRDSDPLTFDGTTLWCRACWHWWIQRA
jgi:hypothetical protein